MVSAYVAIVELSKGSQLLFFICNISPDHPNDLITRRR